MTLRDIQVISGDFVNGSFNLLSISFDRVKACTYFCENVQKLASSGNDERAKWYLRAALGEFRSALEAIGTDIKRMEGTNTWKDSAEEIEMFSHPLVKILTKVRNFSVHSSCLSGNCQEFLVNRIDEQGERPERWRSLFFDQMDKKTNVKGISNVTEDELKWFNRQAKQWPANLVLHSAIYEGSKFVRAFISRRKENG